MTQEALDRLTFDTFVDCGCNAAAAARNLGIAASTVRRRIRRESLRRRASERTATGGRS